MAQGHPEAWHYPLPRLWSEARLARRRENRRLANEAMLARMGVASILSSDAGRAFEDRIKKLMES